MNKNSNDCDSDFVIEQPVSRLINLKGIEWYNNLLSKTQFNNEIEEKISTALDMLSKLKAGCHTGNQSRDDSISAIRHRLNMLIDELENTTSI